MSGLPVGEDASVLYLFLIKPVEETFEKQYQRNAISSEVENPRDILRRGIEVNTKRTEKFEQLFNDWFDVLSFVMKELKHFRKLLFVQ